MKRMGRKSGVVILFLCLLALVSAGYAQRNSVSPFTGSNSALTPTNLEANKCYDCHVKLEDPKLSTPAKEWVEGEHFKNDVACERCHAALVPAGRLDMFGDFGGSYRDDHMDIKLEADVKAPAAFPVEGALGEYTYVIQRGLTKKQATAVCARCHGLTNIDPANKNLENIFLKYKESTHGQSVMVSGGGNPERVGKSEVAFAATGATEAAVCTDCHETHANKKASDPTSKINRANIVTTCASENCHDSDEIAKKYGMVNAYKTYEENIMGRTLVIGSDRAPICPDCHGGAHSILPKEDPQSSIHPDNVVKACSQERCHPGYKNVKLDGKIHLTIPPRFSEAPVETVAFYFMSALLLSVLIVFIPLVALDITRKVGEKRKKGGE